MRGSARGLVVAVGVFGVVCVLGVDLVLMVRLRLLQRRSKRWLRTR